MKLPFFKDKKLGVGTGKGRYDLPLNNGAGAGFMVLLIGLMTFLALIALAGSFALGGITERWSSGLENRGTIEIPAALKNGSVRKDTGIKALSDSVNATLKDHPNIKSLKVLSAEEIHDLVSPWLGESFSSDEYPLPGLISIEMHTQEKAEIKALRDTLKGIAPDIALDTHESWLNDILKLAGSLQLSAGLITLIIALTTVTAIAGAIRSRMAEHRDDVELLHLMGASDYYIMRQFQKHALILSVKGALAGLALTLACFGMIAIVSSSSHAGMLPDLSLSVRQVLIVLMTPIAIAVISWFTARFTVLRVLSLMP